VQRVARCRITFINHKNIISFLLIFSYFLIYINHIMATKSCTVMRHIPMILSMMDYMYDGGPKRLYYYIIILTIVLQLPTAFRFVA
jgi:hypothetical protein